MPAIDRALSYLGLQRKQSEVPIINDGRGNLPSIRVWSVGLGSALWTQANYEALALAGYGRNSDVYACVSLIAQAAKQVKIEQKGRNKASADLLQASGGPSYIESWVSFLLLSGNSFTEIARDGREGVNSLHLLMPHKVSPQISQADFERYPRVQMWRAVDVKGRPYFIDPEDMMHSRLFNPLDPVLGMAPLQAAMLRVDAQNEGSTLLKRLFERGYAPGWVEAAKDSLWEDTQVQQLKERMRLSKTAGDEIFLENATYHPIGFTPIEANVTDQQKMTKRDIAAVFHVPSPLIGDTEAATYSNWQESRRALYTEAVIPLLKHLKEDWNRTIGLELQSELEWDRDSFEAIAQARAEATDRVHKLWASGLITQNEARSDLEYTPVAGGDVFYAPSNFLPLAGSEDEGA